MSERGLTQQQVAAGAMLNPQYLSDLKHGRRTLTELAARRLGEKYEVNHDWLLGLSASREPTGFSSAFASGHTRWVPVFPHPVQGEPQSISDWDGTSVEVVGAAAAQVSHAIWPYAVRFNGTDSRGRLREGDLILITQAVSADAELSVVRHRGRQYIARRLEGGNWERVANGDELPGEAAVCGHCLGIIWGSLNSRR
jgi:hypothetical protein